MWRIERSSVWMFVCVCVCVCACVCVFQCVLVFHHATHREQEWNTKSATMQKARPTASAISMLQPCKQSAYEKMKRIDGLQRRAWFLQRVEAKRGERAIRGKGERVKGQESAHSPWARITDRATERRHVRADSVLIYAHTLI